MDSLATNEGLEKLAKKREIWIDFSRVIAIFTVIYGHSFAALNIQTPSPWTGLIMGPVFDGSAPVTTVLMFFLLSGWLQKTNNKYLAWKQFIFLITPVLIWNSIQICITLNTKNYSLVNALTQLGIWPTFSNANYSLWFLDELAWYSLFLPLIRRIPIKIRVIFIIYTLWISNIYWPQEYAIPRIGNSVAFFLIGTVLHHLKQTSVVQFFKAYSGIVTFIILGYYFLPLVGINISLPTLHHSPLYSIVGCIAILSYGATMEHFFPRTTQFIASSAPSVFFMYAAHVPAFTLYSTLANRYGIPQLSPYLYPVYTIVFVLLSIGCFKLARLTNNRQLLAWIFLYKIRSR